MTGKQIREAFLQFFAARAHQVMSSSSLVPEDPTTLFTTAGMQQFVPWFRREVEPPYGSVVTVQKCARTDDLDQVGRTARHHTFFEMLGNFSFGDYFKEETLRWGWEFTTATPEQGGLGLPADRVWVTYYKPKTGEPYQEDLETQEIWRRIGVPAERIIPLGKKENWWGPVGDSGPCGPCSEMHFDRGAHLACGPDCTSPACGCDRWIEFWNHVFQQFNFQDGQYLPLPAPGIDTGAGLERIASLVQDVPSNFDTDLLRPLIEKTLEIAGVAEADDADQQLALRVIADHLRCAAFMIADGVKPCNTRREYVVRRIIRRAHRFGRVLGLSQPFLGHLVPTLVAMMGDHYRELPDNAQFITDTFRTEEAAFERTLERGEDLLASLIRQAQQRGETVLKGEDVFTLYETYGFPKELTEESALAVGIGLDMDGYAAAEAAHRQASTATGGFAYKAGVAVGPEVPATTFVGYTTTEVEATLVHFAASDDRATAVVLLDKTPFYATSGGQCTDIGVLHFDGTALSVIEATKDKFGHTLHLVDLSGHEEFAPGPHHTVTARVETARRDAIRRAHTATHLLHWALHRVLGEHASQAGSLVDEDYLRFDFSHPQAVTADELVRIEDLVYEHILLDAPVAIRDMSLDEARKEGYTALFGEKYGDWVRTVNIGGGEFDVAFSRELCGGTHLSRTGQAGWFKIIAESSVAAGIRRIEAYTGRKAAEWARGQAAIVRELSLALKAPGDEVITRVDSLQRELKEAQGQINDLKIKAAAGGGVGGPQVEEIAGRKAVISVIEGVDANTLGGLADQFVNKLGSGVAVLAAEAEGKVLFAVKVSKDLTGALKAGDIVREMARLAGGGGGGRPDFAQAGGKDPEKIPDALQKAREMIGG